MEIANDELALSVIIVNWNSAHFLGPCLRALYTNLQDLAFETIVIDNASFDGSGELLRTSFPAVRFIQSRVNLGFGGANNLAAGVARGRALLFLNADTEVQNDAIQQMLSCTESLPDPGAIGPRLLNSDGSLQTTCVQPFPTILNHLFAPSLLRRTFPRSRLWGNEALYRDDGSAVAVQGIVGASLMMRRDTFWDLGGFSTSYFMYAEDMDLCLRAMRGGRVNYYVGSAHVLHHGGGSSAASSDGYWSAVTLRKSLFEFMRIHRGSYYAVGFRVATATCAILRISLLCAAAPLIHGRKSRRDLRYAAGKWVRILGWAVGASGKAS